MEWISAEDRLPEAKGKYLIYGYRIGYNVYMYDPNSENSIRLWKIAVSHWMPLPEKPVKE